ncbi:MAG: BMP family ABC transporter substrate-binding protein [Micrococcales bacterium]|nr:BMP family ABC transporter substrate-binding protein [Micrococcales bacterium]
MAYAAEGRGNQSFNAAAAEGLEQAQSQLGVTAQESVAAAGEPQSAREQRLQHLIDAGCTSIVTIGSDYAPAVKEIAAQNSDVTFGLVDSTDVRAPTIENIAFAENEGSFLVGAAAAFKSQTNVIGFIGDKMSEVGYVAGAKAVKPDIDVRTVHLRQPPDISDSASMDKAAAAAKRMYQHEADVVYQAVRGSGDGVFHAAKAAGKLAIGVGSDEALTADPSVRDVILTSMIKRVDIGVFDFIKSVKEETFMPGTMVFDLKAQGVDYSTTGGKVDDIKDKLEDLRSKIISGEIAVPSS